MQNLNAFYPFFFEPYRASALFMVENYTRHSIYLQSFVYHTWNFELSFKVYENICGQADPLKIVTSSISQNRK